MPKKTYTQKLYYVKNLPKIVGLDKKAFASLELDEKIPYWRVLKSKGELNPKFPNAPEEQITLLESEGFSIIKKGRKNFKYFVKNFDKYLVDI